MSEFSESIYDKVRNLVLQGKEESYESLVEKDSEVLEKLQRLVKRIQKVAPDVALSPYIVRALRVLEQNQVSDGGSISAAA